MSVLSVLFNFVKEILVSVIRQRKEIKGIRIKKEVLKMP